MKKIISLFLVIITLLLSLASCDGYYRPRESTKKEKETVIKLSFENETYEVKYELWRALYLTHKDEVEGEGEEYVAKINALILERAADIYSVLALCDRVGINLYSRSVEGEIEQYITESIEGGANAIGYGSYENYLKALKDMNLNYSVAVLLLRYEIGMRELDNYYIGSFDTDDIQNGIEFGNLTYTREDIKNYYYSDECVRVLRAHLQADAYYEPDTYADEIRQEMEEAAIHGESAVAGVIINNSITSYYEAERGYVMARHNLNKLYYSELTDAAFGLNTGEVSEPVHVNSGDGEVIFILYCAEKSDAHFDKSYSEIAYVYLTDTVGKTVAEVQSALVLSAEYTDSFYAIDYGQVSMNE